MKYLALTIFLTYAPTVLLRNTASGYMLDPLPFDEPVSVQTLKHSLHSLYGFSEQAIEIIRGLDKLSNDVRIEDDEELDFIKKPILEFTVENRRHDNSREEIMCVHMPVVETIGEIFDNESKIEIVRASQTWGSPNVPKDAEYFLQYLKYYAFGYTHEWVDDPYWADWVAKVKQDSVDTLSFNEDIDTNGRDMVIVTKRLVL